MRGFLIKILNYKKDLGCQFKQRQNCCTFINVIIEPRSILNLDMVLI